MSIKVLVTLSLVMSYSIDAHAGWRYRTTRRVVSNTNESTTNTRSSSTLESQIANLQMEAELAKKRRQLELERDLQKLRSEAEVSGLQIDDESGAVIPITGGGGVGGGGGATLGDTADDDCMKKLEELEKVIKKLKGDDCDDEEPKSPQPTEPTPRARPVLDLLRNSFGTLFTTATDAGLSLLLDRLRAERESIPESSTSDSLMDEYEIYESLIEAKLPEAGAVEEEDPVLKELKNINNSLTRVEGEIAKLKERVTTLELEGEDDEEEDDEEEDDEEEEDEDDSVD